jgi:Flp pilus assembly protein TadD
VLGESGLFADTEKEARALIAVAPSDPEAHNLLGVALAQQEQFEPAGDQFREALSLDASYQQARTNLARVEALLARGRR